jgi:hypothetical protein
MLALVDRSCNPGTLSAPRTLPTPHFHEVVFEPFAVPSRAPMVWRMVYFKRTLTIDG